MRLFVCTWLSPDNQAFFGREVAALVAASGGLLRAIPPDSAHITYAFLARVDQSDLHDLVDAVREVASSREPIPIELGPASILYARAEARLVYTPIACATHALDALRSAIVATVQRRLPDVEISGSRSPHVTLARFRKHTHRRSTRAVAETMAQSPVARSNRQDRIAEIQVVSSELSGDAPRYATLARMPL